MQDPRSERFIRSRMKTRRLVLLDELGEHRSILHAALAAIAANMTQPAASKMLSELEQLPGAPLFERLPRGVTPTPFGEIMIRRARAALAEMNLAHQEVMNLMSGLNGRVAVGTVLTPATDAAGLAQHRGGGLDGRLRAARSGRRRVRGRDAGHRALRRPGDAHLARPGMPCPARAQEHAAP